MKQIGFWFLLTLTFLSGLKISNLRAENINKASENEIKIGSLASLTGYGAYAGNAELQGAILATEDINRSGGINDRKIKLISEDTQSDPKQTISAYKKLKSLNNVDAIIGPNWSEFAEPLAPIANEDRTILITPSGHTPNLLKNRPYVFSLQFPAKEAVVPVTSYITSRNFSEVIIFVSPNAFYEMLSQTIVDALKDKIKISSEIVSSDNLDFKSSINRIRSKKDLGIVVFLLENGPAATFVKQAKSQGIKSSNLMLGPIVRYDEILKKDNALTQGIIHFDYDYETPEDFNKKYRSRFNTDPTFGSAQSYDSVLLLKEGMEKCRNQPDLLLNCISGANFKGVSGDIEFEKTRDRITKRPVIRCFEIIDGVSKPL